MRYAFVDKSEMQAVLGDWAPECGNMKHTIVCETYDPLRPCFMATGPTQEEIDAMPKQGWGNCAYINKDGSGAIYWMPFNRNEAFEKLLFQDAPSDMPASQWTPVSGTKWVEALNYRT